MTDLFEQFEEGVRTGDWKDSKAKFLRALEHVRTDISGESTKLAKAGSALFTIAEKPGKPMVPKDKKKLAEQVYPLMNKLKIQGEGAFANLSAIESDTRGIDWDQHPGPANKREPAGKKKFTTARKQIRVIYRKLRSLSDKDKITLKNMVGFNTDDVVDTYKGAYRILVCKETK